jgi:DNA polymerase III epsilon subunit-like protein
MGKLVVGIDLETTGLSATDDRITEIGGALVDWDTQTPLKVMSTLVNPGRPIPEGITKLTDITDEMVDLYGKSEKVAFAELHDLMSYADYAAAFNGSRFDQPFYLAACARLKVEPSGIFWLDLSSDVKYPPEITTRNLNHLASEFGFCNPFRHRSLFDVMTMFKIAKNYDLDSIIARAQEPTVYVQAMVDFNNNQKAKDFSFRWNPDQKKWWKAYKLSDYEAEKSLWQFTSRMLDGPLE